VIGLLLVLWVRRRAALAPAAPAVGSRPLELRDLDGRVAALLVQLRELEDAAAKRTPEQLARERYALELEAARALQSRDVLAARASAAPAPAASAAPASAAHGFLWGAVSSAVVAVMLFLVFQAAERRPEGGSVTGGIEGARPRGGAAPGGEGGAASSAENEAPPDAETLELRGRLAKNPDDHDTRLALARHLLMQRDLMGVWNETQYVLERKPGHARALTYQSLVRLAMGQGDVAVSMLKQAIAAEPDLLEARQNLAFVYASLGRSAEASAEVSEIASRSPAEAERLKHALEQLAQSKQEAPPAEPHADVPPPSETASARAAAPAASGSGSAVFGWIEAEPAVASRIRPGTVIFLTVRPAGVSSGPPAAVKRLESSGFPLQFEVGSGDSMMGQPLPDSMRIDVRADSDGDPMTRPATDPAGFADGVAAGKTGVRIALR
jgi:tetratricopeptide (TPR) repeat protein